MKSTVQYYRVDRCQISFIKFILEAYDNLAVVTTLDAHAAIVQVTVAPGCETVVDGVFNCFSPECNITPLDRLPSCMSTQGGCAFVTEGPKREP